MFMFPCRQTFTIVALKGSISDFVKLAKFTTIEIQQNGLRTIFQ